MKTTEEVARHVLMMYMQEWGQTIEERIESLNSGVKAAGLDATFIQDNERSGWEGKDGAKAAEFRKRLQGCWCGEFNQEARNVQALIEEFKAVRS